MTVFFFHKTAAIRNNIFGGPTACKNSFVCGALCMIIIHRYQFFSKYALKKSEMLTLLCRLEFPIGLSFPLSRDNQYSPETDVIH